MGYLSSLLTTPLADVYVWFNHHLTTTPDQKQSDTNVKPGLVYSYVVLHAHVIWPDVLNVYLLE